jgi:FG-GAP repeat
MQMKFCPSRSTSTVPTLQTVPFACHILLKGVSLRDRRFAVGSTLRRRGATSKVDQLLLKNHTLQFFIHSCSAPDEMSSGSRRSESLAAQVGSKTTQLTRCGDQASETARIPTNETLLKSPQLRSRRECRHSLSFNEMDISTKQRPETELCRSQMERIARQVGDKVIGNRALSSNESELSPQSPQQLFAPLSTRHEHDAQRATFATSVGLVEDSLRVRHRRCNTLLDESSASNPEDAQVSSVGTFYSHSPGLDSHLIDDRGLPLPLQELSGLNTTSETVVTAVAAPASGHQSIIPVVDGFSSMEPVYAVVDGLIVDDDDEDSAAARISKRLQLLQLGSCVLLTLAAGLIVWIIIVACTARRSDASPDSTPTWILVGSELSARQSLTEAGDERPEPLHFLGKSVAMSGNGTRVAISAPGADNGFELNVGEVLIFDATRGSIRGLGEWLLAASIKGDRAGDSSAGSSISLSKAGTRLAIGRPTVEAGEVEIYDFKTDHWHSAAHMVGTAAESRTSTGSLGWFGHSTSLSSDGTLLSVGAPLALNASRPDMVGLVKVFEYVDSDWVQLGQDVVGRAADGLFGWSTVVDRFDSQARLVVGCPGYDDERGAVRILEWSASASWVPVAEFEGDWPLLRFGEALSVSSDGRVVAVGARGVAFETGHVHVYRESTESWDRESVPLSGAELSEGFGSAVSLSGNGDVLAVGAPMSSSFGPGGGRVAIFKYDGFAWRQDGPSIGRQPGDEFGSSVALATDGRKLVVGAPSSTDDGRIGDSGCALVYGSAV